MREPEAVKRLRRQFKSLRAMRVLGAHDVHAVWGIKRTCDELFGCHWLADHERKKIARIAAQAVS